MGLKKKKKNQQTGYIYRILTLRGKKLFFVTYLLVYSMTFTHFCSTFFPHIFSQCNNIKYPSHVYCKFVDCDLQFLSRFPSSFFYLCRDYLRFLGCSLFFAVLVWQKYQRNLALL